MFQVEFHCHTHASHDSLTQPCDLLAMARRKGLDRVVVTDHNSIAGALEAHEIDPQRVIVGEEIMTTEGEILAAFVREEIPAGLPAREVVAELRRQKAFISVSHPFDSLRAGGWKEANLLEILPLVDAIEVYNSRCMLPRFNRQALAFARLHNIPGTVGSDAHAAFELGRARLMLEHFNNAEELKQAMRAAKAQVRWSPWWFHLISRYAQAHKRL